MTVFPLSHYDLQSLNLHISSVPFFKAIQRSNPDQYALLMGHCNIMMLEKNEPVCQQGDLNSFIFFVLKGKFSVQVVSQGKSCNVNSVTPGEVFGDIAVLNRRARNAYVIADESSAKHTILSLDYAVFGKLTDFNLVSLSTKLAYYRNMTHNLRWKLEGYRLKHPKQAAIHSHRVVKLFSGCRDSVDELVSLDRQAKQLSSFLDAWNDYFKIKHCQNIPTLHSFSDGIRA